MYSCNCERESYNKKQENECSTYVLSLFPTRDSWFFGDTICRIWIYIAAHKNHCYIWWRIRASIPLPPLVTWSRYTTVVHYVGHFCRMDVFVMYGDSCITSKWCFDNLGLKIYLCEHKFYIFLALIFYYLKFSNFFRNCQRITF